MASIEIDTLRSREPDTDIEIVVIVRVVDGNVALAISDESNGDTEVVLDAPMATKVAEALRRAATQSNH